MNKKNILLASTLLISANAFAETNDFYVQGQGAPLSVMKSYKNKNVPFRISGGYNFAHINDWTFGAELGYLHWNKRQSIWIMQNSMKSIRGTTVNGSDLLLVADYNLGQGFHLLGKGGLLVFKESRPKNIFIFDGMDSQTQFKTGATRISPEIAGGLGYDFTENFGLNAMVTQNFGTKRIANTVALLGLKVNF